MSLSSLSSVPKGIYVKKEIIIDAEEKPIRLALLEDKKLVELHEQAGEDRLSVGDIYLARVKKIAPGLNAAFVDLGCEKDAFLHYHDLGPQVQSALKYTREVNENKYRSSHLNRFAMEPDIPKSGAIGDVLQAGQRILVQIEKEPISTKGPRISAEISIAGRYLVLAPFSARLSISQKIESKHERDRLKRLINSIKPKGFGVIIRTVAQGKKVAELDADLNHLMNRWNSAYKQIRGNDKFPKRILSEIHKASLILRDIFSDEFVNIVCNEAALAEEIRDYLQRIAPDAVKLLTHHRSQLPVFESYGVDKQIKQAFGRTVSLSKGAYLIIETTEAMHVIDVNSGSRAASKESQEENSLQVNLLAATEIAHQLRLRDMGGIVVIDFIDMKQADNRKKLFDHLRGAMEVDRAKHKILPLSPFGLIQITRQRVRPALHIKTREPNPSNGRVAEVEAPITLIDKIESFLSDWVESNRREALALHVHPFVAAYLRQGIPSVRQRWWLTYKKWVKVVPRNAFQYLEYKFYSAKQLVDPEHFTAKVVGESAGLS